MAAARTLGRELAKIRTGDDEPAPEQMRLAIRDCITHCIYGVDKNPLAVDLCKVALWIEGHAKGKPLTFLDHRIRCGDSLIGVMDLTVLKEGIPDDAFKPVLGDDKEVARAIKKRNKQERLSGQKRLPFEAGEEIQELVSDYRLLTELPDDTPEQVRRKAEIYQRIQSQGSKWWEDNTACHMWTAAFFVELTEKSVQESCVPTTDTLQRYLETRSAHGRLIGEVWDLAMRYRFFHWPLEFPEVFLPHLREPIANSEQPIGTHHSLLATRRSPSSRHSPLTTGHWPFANTGFDVVLGNPPWEQIELSEKEFFTQKEPKIASAPNAAARKELIQELSETNPALFSEFLEAKRDIACETHFIRFSGRYPLNAVGRINSYQIFAGLCRSLISKTGRVGIVIPTGIATDDSNKKFFADLVDKRALVSLYDFENREGIFPGVHRSYKFCLLTIGGQDAAPDGADFAFFLTNVDHLKDDNRHFSLTSKDIALLNPNTRTCPIFRSKRDAEITKSIYRRVPVLIDESKGEEGNPWGIAFKQGLFNMASDSHLFRNREQLEAEGWRLEGNVFVKDGERYLPLYEAKMIHQYNHRHASVKYSGGVKGGKHDLEYPSEKELCDPSFLVMPRFWVRAGDVRNACGEWLNNNRWFLCYRRITRAVDFTTSTFAIIPEAGVGDTSPILLVKHAMGAPAALFLCANFNSFVVNYIARQKISGIHLDFYPLKQLAVLPPRFYESQSARSLASTILKNALFLIYVSNDLASFAKDSGYDGSPFPWEEDRRLSARCEIEAVYFHLYGIDRDDVDYIMETFPI
ncbi:MAG: hypothetical protein JRH06_15975, partial [Deltaproteobacteria bacterium]|nr:hypothetical protein [Deltaproteobacteria bacterium]